MKSLLALRWRDTEPFLRGVTVAISLLRFLFFIFIPVVDLGLLAFPEAKALSEDFIPNSNSAKLILASPSISNLLKMAINSYLVAICPIPLKNRFKLL